MAASVGLLTDRYELTMLAAALRDGTSDTPCVFEVFTRRLPGGRRYGVVAGTARVLEAVTAFGVDADELAWLEQIGALDGPTADYLRNYRFTGRVDGYPEGEVFFPNSPILTVRVTLEGKGNAKNASAPALTGPPALKIYEPSTTDRPGIRSEPP